MVDIITLLLLLLIQLAQPSPSPVGSRCECDCTCGHGQHIPGKLESVNGEVAKADWDSHVNEFKSLNDSEDDILDQSNEGDIESKAAQEQQSRNIDRDGKRDYSTRPVPPHLDRSAPDWVSPYISKRQSRSERQCEQCYKSFGSASALKMHTNASHGLSSPAIRSTTLIQRPSERATSPLSTVSNPALTCELCQEVFASKFDLRAHKSAKHSWSIICLDCLTTFAHAQDARRHYEFIHGSSHLSPERTQGMLDTIQAASAATPKITQYPTHSIQEYYTCAECGMIFGHANDLNQHLSSPYAHGGAHFTVNDFPPLTGIVDGPGSIARDLVPSTNPSTVWDQETMPKFTLATTPLPTEGKVGLSPQATLEPDDYTSVSSMASIRIELTASGSTSDGESQNVIGGWIESQDYGVEPAAKGIDDREFDQGWSEEIPLIAPDFINDTPSPLMEDEPQPTSLPSQAKALVGRPPLAVVPPYVRAVLKLGLMDSLSYSDDEYEGAGAGADEALGGSEKERMIVIGGIECQIPSFTYTSTTTNTKKIEETSITITSAPSLLLSADDDDEQQSKLIIDEDGEVDEWAAAEEVARFAWGEGYRRPTISLDLNAPQNGNRPKPIKQNTTSKKRGGDGGAGGGTFLTVVQRDNFQKQKEKKKKEKEKEKVKAAPAPALQPQFENGWSELPTSISMTNSSGSGRGGHQLSENELKKRNYLDNLQRQKIVREQALASGAEDPFGGW